MEILTPAMVYWVSMADQIRDFLWSFPTFVFLVCCFWGLAKSNVGYDEKVILNKKEKTLLVTLLIAVITCLIIRVFMPSSKTLAAMYVLQPIVNNESVQALPSEVLDFVRGYIKQYTPKDIDDV